MLYLTIVYISHGYLKWFREYYYGGKYMLLTMESFSKISSSINILCMENQFVFLYLFSKQQRV